MSRYILALLLGFGSSSVAWAGRPAMDPQIKVHLGASVVEGPSGVGLMGGMDSRLTRFLYVDMGAVASVKPLPLTYDLDLEGSAPEDFFRLRHSIYVLPGFRIPHAQPQAFSWDFTFRVGPAVVWSADLSPNDPRTTPNTTPYLEIDVAAAGGADIAVMLDHVGLRATGRVFVLTPFYEDQWIDVPYWGPQFGLEGFWQF